MEIGSVLSRAWQIIWKFKVLWIFGILSACASTNWGPGNFRWSERYRGELPPQLQPYINLNIPQWQIALLVGILVIVILILIVLAIFLGTMGRIGLIRGTLQAEEGATALTFGSLFNSSLPYFWRVFGLNLLVGLALAVAFGLVIFFGVIGSIITLGLGLLCFIPLLCLLAPISWFIQIVIEQANIAIVVENLGILDGLRRGWDVVKNNLGIAIVMGLILVLGVGLIGGFIIGLPVVAIIGPAVLGAIAGTRTAIGGGLLVSGLCLVAYIPVAILLNGILLGYIHTAWALTYLRLTRHPVVLEPVNAPAGGGAEVF